ncbi:bifunctional oligoribonuclease/PAP phosphatase NrnA [Cesiribacter sp. SM1]|uniref:DHH family phosphoesterase n=1 Tax=Cesiribacter sp. SM1 TaxID=2861196 RepID=UPI001CD27AE6|nr:bifunctional oligoribonuclease/PAP phosphatase NrnA [Cesiribacter sp. SM1]
MQQVLNAFREALSLPRRVVITTHHKPDADALGSSLGLAGYLKKKGHHVSVISPTDYPAFLAWMKGNDEVIIFNEGNEARSAQLVADAELIFCLDFSSLARINELGELVRQSPAEKVLIDHHLEPEDFAKYSFWTTEAASTAELVFQLILDLGDKDLIDAEIAEALYSGIMTDTGSFKHPSTTARTHEIVADLIRAGANVHKVSKLVYDTNSLERLRFLGFALSEKLQVLTEYNTAYMAISAEELQQYQSKTGDTEGLVNYALSVQGVVMAALIVERQEAIKISFRSIGEFSVNAFARNHFEGGGHKNAAGGVSYQSLEETVNKFVSLLPQYKDQLQAKVLIYE